MSNNPEADALKAIIEQQQRQIELLIANFPKVQTAAPIEQERVDTPEDDDKLLDIAPLPTHDKEEESSGGSGTLIDVGEEEVADEEPEEPEIVTPKMKKDTSLMDVEILEEGESGRGNRACVRVPLSRQPRKNRFRDNPAFAKVDTTTFDKKVRTDDSVRAHQFIEKRPIATKVIVRCRECSRKFRIDSQLAPARYDGGDISTYQCDSCILRRKG